MRNMILQALMVSQTMNSLLTQLVLPVFWHQKTSCFKRMISSGHGTTRKKTTLYTTWANLRSVHRAAYLSALTF